MSTFKIIFIGYMTFLIFSLLFNMFPSIYVNDYIMFGFILLIGVFIESI